MYRDKHTLFTFYPLNKKVRTSPNMYVTPGISPAVVAIASFCLVKAQIPWVWNGNNYGGSEVAPWGLNPSFFSSLLSQPNATGTYPISGPSVSSENTGGWQWQIAVRADIPINNTTSPQKVAYHGEAFTGVEITLQSPGNVSSEFQMCVMNWDLSFGSEDALYDDDGTCSSVLSDACRSDVASAVSENWDTRKCQCPDLRSISSCSPGPPFNSSCVAYRKQLSDSTLRNE